MSNKKFKEKKIIINTVFTKRGDKGYTELIGGSKVKKNDIRISAFGEVDELNSLIGSCSVYINEHCNTKLKAIVLKLDVIQHELFNLGNMLATCKKFEYKNMPKIDSDSIKSLEDSIVFFNKDLKTLNSFVLPGGNELNVRFHIARTVCRRCERLVVELSNLNVIDSKIIIYLNRLSDLLFVFSRYINHVLKNNEVTWNPNYNKT